MNINNEKRNCTLFFLGANRNNQEINEIMSNINNNQKNKLKSRL